MHTNINLYTVRDPHGQAILKGSQLALIAEVTQHLAKKLKKPLYITSQSNTVVCLKTPHHV